MCKKESFCINFNMGYLGGMLYPYILGGGEVVPLYIGGGDVVPLYIMAQKKG